METKLVAYLAFDGNCAEAMQFYQAVLGGDLSLQTFGDALPETPETFKDRVMHAQLARGTLMLMASDTHPEYGKPLAVGNNVSLSLIGSDEAALTRHFKALSEGGSIDMPLEKQFWGDVFGMCTDTFGMHWMVNISTTKES